MKLGIAVGKDELQKTREWVYTPKGYTYEEGEPKVTLQLRPWTRTTQGVVDKRARVMNIGIMDAETALKGIGTGDKKAEAYVRVLADYLIADWDGIVFGNDFSDPNTGESYKAGDPIPCTAKYKVFVFEDTEMAVEIVNAAKGFASTQIEEEVKNFDRSSGSTLAPQSVPSQMSE